VSGWISIQDAVEILEAMAGNTRNGYVGESGLDADSVLYADLPAAIYHADRDALSCSLLKPLLISPAHFQQALAKPSTPSPAKDFGSLLHLLLLEPDKVPGELAVFPGVGSLRDREFKTFLAANSQRLAVDEPTFAQARRLAEKVATTCFRGRQIWRFLEESRTECSLYFTEPTTGLKLRSRFDALHPEFTFDLKTTRHESAGNFARDALALGYDLQAAMYSLGRTFFEGKRQPPPFVFITAESMAPNSVCTLVAGPTFMENGAAKLQECLTTYKACTMVGHWPDLGCHSTLEIQPWQQFQPGRDWQAASPE
jgi:hypothetical protein